MNIEDLTIKQAKELAAMFGNVPSSNATVPHVFVGKYVICRCNSAGVHAGELAFLHGDIAILQNSRRLWLWKANSGIALSGLSQHGLMSGKVDTILPEIYLSGVIEVIPCSEKAKDSINAA